MKCPFCSCEEFYPSPLSTEFDKVYKFHECRDCRSLVCDPMPDEEALMKMYDVEYFEGTPHDFSWVTEFLQTIPTGTFIDYGCGTGHCALEVHKLGWRSIGIEYNPKTVEMLNAKYPFEVVQSTDVKADVIHLADVLEHLTDLETQFPAILSMLKPGGHLLATAPLEGNKNLFQRTIMWSQKVKKSVPSGAPYHVTLSTTKGQKEFFKRHNLKTVSFSVSEICFPAPYRLKECKTPRTLALYSVRRLSQLLSGAENGNRFFYIGQAMSESVG